MAYVSLYRKYRPQTFEDVVGQEHVTTTLQNAIRSGHIASGYLFCGTRGTAKTTCARILAKALNCVGPAGTLDHASPHPCGECGPCRSIASSSFVDVLEMDAASHGKVDDVRDLVGSIKFPPMEGRYKVYIIDEAHQLSRDAMDAFLKTLEEPPDRVVFVLATTELDKLPITIASRCQVFEFRRGSIAQIGQRIQSVLEAEGVTMEPAAASLVARAAEGSYRDSLSILEQVLAFKPDAITASDVTSVLGTVDMEFLTRTVHAIAASDAVAAFALAEDILSNGKEVRSFLKTLTGHFRDLLYVSVGARPTWEFGAEHATEISEQAALFSPAALLRAIDVLTAAERDLRWNTQHRILLEAALLRLIRLPDGGAPAVGEMAARAPAVKSAAPAPSRPAVPTPAIHAATPPPSRASEPAVSEVRKVAEMPSAAAPVIEAPDPDDVVDEMPEPEEDPDEGTAVLLASSLPNTRPSAESNDNLLQVQQVAAIQEMAPTAPSGPTLSTDGPADLLRLQRSWQEVVNRMENTQSSGVPLVKDAWPAQLNGSTITLRFTSRFFVDKIQSKARGRAIFEEIINKTLNVPEGTYQIKCVLAGTEGDGVKKPPAAPVREPIPAVEPMHSPLMDEAIAVFGGHIIEEN